MNPEAVRLLIPFTAEAPWIVRRDDASRVGTYPTRAEAICAAMRVRAKLARAWGLEHPPVRVQESDGSWRELPDSDPTTLVH
ncbi:MAG: DUF2188 domain-containing protein [Frateuria sp.]|uniref:DUF2188 domain-containing protein n=1 Tax=Frateuria sp. TaxID=2211372 RepID=UPI0018497075|nr:DUF2188 domain-containing protein [Frateuria sp.]NUO72404.1 DUF2188 domain-containing protein [Frateuria sp.]NUR21927.1 DUF2188 domain-containing protein [Frateuria sp.]